jgi:hypothetical protein
MLTFFSFFFFFWGGGGLFWQNNWTIGQFKILRFHLNIFFRLNCLGIQDTGMIEDDDEHVKQNWSAMRKRSGVTKVVKGADLNSAK